MPPGTAAPGAAEPVALPAASIAGSPPATVAPLSPEGATAGVVVLEIWARIVEPPHAQRPIVAMIAVRTPALWKYVAIMVSPRLVAPGETFGRLQCEITEGGSGVNQETMYGLL